MIWPGKFFWIYLRRSFRLFHFLLAALGLMIQAIFLFSVDESLFGCICFCPSKIEAELYFGRKEELRKQK
jgi:hypothetical protein